MKGRQKPGLRESTGKGETIWQNSNVKLKGALPCFLQEWLIAIISGASTASSPMKASEKMIVDLFIILSFVLESQPSLADLPSFQ